MSSREDIIEIPIEIQTSDLEELNKLIQELQEAKGTVESARATRKIKSTGTGAPIQRQDPEILSIFKSDPDRDILPMKTRDTKSKQAVTRGDSFHEMQKQIQELQKTNNSVLPMITQIGATLGFSVPPFIQSGIGVVQGMKRKLPTLNFSPMPSPAKINTGSKFAKLGLNMGKSIPFIGAAFVLVDFLLSELPEILNEQLYGVGKKLDRRFKRVIEKEYASGSDREVKAQIAQGYRSVITTSFVGARGATNVANSKERALNGENIYNKSNEYMY